MRQLGVTLRKRVVGWVILETTYDVCGNSARVHKPGRSTVDVFGVLPLLIIPVRISADHLHVFEQL